MGAGRPRVARGRRLTLDPSPVEPPAARFIASAERPSPNDRPPVAPLDDVAERARILLDATNAFLACDDLDGVGAAIVTAIDAMFRPDKIAVTVAEPDGGLRLAHALGYDPAELDRIRQTLRSGQGLAWRVLGGEALWSDDPDRGEFRERIESFGAKAGFSLAIHGPAGVVGTCGAIYCEDRGFDDTFRTAARGLAAQAGLTASLIASRDDVRRSAAESERQRRRSDTLLELSSLLAGVQDAGRIADLACEFIRRASGAPFAMVGRRAAASGGERFRIAATDGLAPDQVARIAAALEHPDRPSLQALLGGFTTSRTGEAAVGAGMGIERATAAPIVVDGRTEGFLAIGAPAGAAVLPAEWQELLVAFAALTATAIGRADAVSALAAQRDLLATEVDARTRSLRAALDDLVVASEAKTDLLANVSHELRTPLTAILGFSEVLATGLDGPLNELQQRDLTTIQSSSRHLLELIDDLIDIASIEAGRVQLNIEPLDPVELIDDCIATIRPLAESGEIDVTFASSATTARMRLEADRGRLREIVLNLLSNAVKFTPRGGQVVVELTGSSRGLGVMAGPAGADLGHAVVPPEPPSAVIIVRDSGPGIAPEHHDRIFEKFTRVADPAVPGTGLGLAISRELARLHGGDVTVESSLGAGSAFIVRVPLVSAQ